MGKQMRWLAVLLMLGVTVMPPNVYAQLGDLAQPSPNLPLPFGSVRADQSGFFVAGEFMYWQQTNPIKNEVIAYRGILDVDGSITAGLSPVVITPVPNTFLGSGDVALTAGQVAGPNNWQPGFNFTMGYRFEDGVSLELRWIHLDEAHYSATASLLPPTGPAAITNPSSTPSIGGAGENTFLTSFVYNFPPSYFGPGNTTLDASGNRVGSAIAMFGIWDGSSLQTIQFLQRFDQVELTARIPIWEGDYWRSYGLVGPRLASLWERFTWITVHPETDSEVGPQDSATYSNVVSNRLYGVHYGIGNEWLLGDTPAGAFSISCDLQGALFMDFMKGRPKYELGDRSTATGHGRNLFSIVPEADGSLMLWWYPYKGIVCRIGYEGMAFFNTFSSPNPVDFNFGSISPEYTTHIIRLMEGVNMGMGFIF